jgi:hypothetical protein
MTLMSLQATVATARAQTFDLENALGLDEWRDRVERSRRAHVLSEIQARLDAVSRAAERSGRPPAATGAIEDFIADETLRKGDVVVTDKGFRVYRGANGDPGERDFRRLEPRDKPSRLRGSLRDLERASGFIDNPER